MASLKQKLGSQKTYGHSISSTLLLDSKIVSEYDQEIPQSQTADNPVAPRGRAAQDLQNDSHSCVLLSAVKNGNEVVDAEVNTYLELLPGTIQAGDEKMLQASYYSPLTKLTTRTLIASLRNSVY